MDEEQQLVHGPAQDTAAVRSRTMLRRVEVTATLDHPVERVFAYLADPMRWHDFAPACIYRRQIGAEAPRVGTRWEATDLIGPFPMRFVDELLELEPNRRVAWWSSAPWNARVEYACEPTSEGGTQVRATYEGNISGSLCLLVGWLPGRVTWWILAQDFRRLGHVLDREERRHAQHPATEAAPWLAESDGAG
jgi:uncharacterized protein YndB with AHSA1/START domain